MTAAGRILERIRIIEQSLNKKPEPKESTPVKDLSNKEKEESSSAGPEERKIAKIIFYMNG